VVCYSGGRFLRYDRKDRHIEIIGEEKPGEILDQKRILLFRGWMGHTFMAIVDM